MATEKIWALCRLIRAMVILVILSGLPAVYSFVDLMVDVQISGTNLGHKTGLPHLPRCFALRLLCPRPRYCHFLLVVPCVRSSLVVVYIFRCFASAPSVSETTKLHFCTVSARLLLSCVMRLTPCRPFVWTVIMVIIKLVQNTMNVQGLQGLVYTIKVSVITAGILRR
jgi:hypothetical protein